MKDTAIYQLSSITSGLTEGTDTIRFHPHTFEEPVSALPLALLLVFGTVIILGIISGIWEYFSKQKNVKQVK